MSAAHAMNRTLVVWCADWPVASALGEQGLPRHLPAAVFAQNRVQASNQAARDFGIKRGMRRRDAQSRCPEVQVLAADELRDTRAFEEVLTRLEELRPGVMPLRPGLVALRSPARFYGGEAEAGAAIAECVVGLGVWDVRIGIADELFTAEQAARSAGLQETYAVPVEGGSAAFLRALPVHVLEDANTVSLLQRLGLTTLGGLADLPGADVKARFGAQAAWVRRVIHGEGLRPVAGRTPPPELATEVAFEPPLDSAEAVCFSSRQAAGGFVKGLAARQEVCTEVRIEVAMETASLSRGADSCRTWAHPRWFSSADLIDRLHWQLAGVDGGGAVTQVRFVPEVAVPEAVHADGLWGGTDQRVERGIARVQGLLGREAVVAPVIQGGRSPRERQAYVPWGDRPTTLRDRALPWPGSIPPPAPARVLADPWPAEVCDQAGRQVVVLPRGGLSGEPVRYRPTAAQPWQRIASWAGPWPVTDGWWEPGGGRRVARFQLVGVDGRAWLATFDTDHWVTEASYD
ncbi:protein ImuB [Nocardioides albertanoniae]|uniref:Protein ImuB n=1 Tax=Nocardioides albertanoniae TaxID=1175486 RepID=A0A543A5A1_9ACTN|nr:DNA polymerase Y family protein [Nocardioides albertanoniae]TQL67717.1 protein ImuB [Nocardioides albertanoniae]